MELKDKLVELRKNKNYTTRKLAEEMNVSQSTISLWEKGERKPDYKNIVKLANLFDVSTDYILGIENSGNDYIKQLSELNNNLETEITNKVEALELLKTKLNTLYDSMHADTKYLEIKMKEQNINTDISSNETIEIVEKSIKNKKERIEELKKQLFPLEKEITNINHERHRIYQQYVSEKEKKRYIESLYKGIKNNDYEYFNIFSKHDLAVVALYLFNLTELSNMVVNKNFSEDVIIESVALILHKEYDNLISTIMNSTKNKPSN